MLSLVGVVIISIVFLANASSHRKETVMGYLEPSVGLAKVSVQRANAMHTLYVENGNTVSAGAL
ncbi:MAG: membrane fusion protein [Paraglaciecola sp.]|jgi:membrane fusion protein